MNNDFEKNMKTREDNYKGQIAKLEQEIKIYQAKNPEETDFAMYLVYAGIAFAGLLIVKKLM